MITGQVIYDTALELHKRVSVKIPNDVLERIREMSEQETQPHAGFVLKQVLENYEAAAA